MTKNSEKPDKDLGAQIVEKALGGHNPEVLQALFSAQNTPEQRSNLKALFDKRLTIDKEK